MMMYFLLVSFLGLSFDVTSAWISSPTHSSSSSFHRHVFNSPSTALAMGLLDGFSNFLSERTGDFVRLKSNEKAFGPGPLLILYKVPRAIDDEEISDMLEDGAQEASKRGVRLARIEEGDDIMNLTLEDSLNQIVAGSFDGKDEENFSLLPNSPPSNKTPVLFFSGFQNDEMMNTYNILGPEIMQETMGQQIPACAKAVPNAMEKTLRQVLEEISGDHRDAISMRTKEAQE